MRKSFTKFQRDTILSNQDLKCNICHTKFGKGRVWHFDHINGNNTDNRTENGQAICANCHDVKSRNENVQRSRTKKDQDYVKRCPCCNDKLKGKDYGQATDYLSANVWISCNKFPIMFKVIRHDPSNMRKSTNKKFNETVSHCISGCGEFSEPQPSNIMVHCFSCNSKFYVWVKERKK